jgi:hypothetical protein
MGAYEGPTNFLNVGASPSLMLNFAREKSLRDQISGKDLVTFTRSSTGTYVGADGLIKTAPVDEARFDHDPVTGESLGLLIEESRTNLLLRSEEFDDASWTKGANTIVTANYAVAPNGTTTADRFEMINAAGTFISGSATVVSGLTYTFSVYARATAATSTFDMQLGANVAFPVLTAQWQRYSLSFTATGSSLTATIGNGPDAADFLAWGAQLEVGSFPTSYIPTSASAVTRQPDNAQITGTNFTDWYNASDGTIFTVSRLHSVTSTQNFTEIQIDDGTQSNRIFHYIAQSDAKAKFQSWGSDTLTPNTVIPGIDFKHSSSYNSQSYITCLDGQLSSEGNTGTQVSLTEAHLGYNHSNNYLNGHLKQLIYYPARISDIKLQQMTKVFS